MIADCEGCTKLVTTLSGRMQSL